jgi:Lrp/AsnC family transcriptional regulator for asnA, asnC and gidA
VKIDDVDMKIISCLEENGRIPNNEIASRLSLSEGTVRNRIHKLLDYKFLRIKGLTNPNIRKDKLLVFILVKVALHKEWEKIGKKLSEIPEVKSVSMVTGRFDIILEVHLAPDQIMHFISEQISDIKNILSTESLIVVKSYEKWV